MLPVVILAAGGGKRLGPLGAAYPKVLLPVGQGTLLSRHFEEFYAIGARRFVLVVDALESRVAMEARDIAKSMGVELDIAVQSEPKGIGHATLVAEPLIRSSAFILVLGDTYYVPRDLKAGIRLLQEGLDAVLSVRLVDDEALIRRECTITIGQNGLVEKIVEKPENVLGPYKPCGVYFFGPAMFEALHKTSPSPLRNEVELTDAIQTMIDDGGKVGVFETLETDLNVTVPSDLLEANMVWLSKSGIRVSIAPSAHIGKGGSLEQVVLGRGVKIGDGAMLKRVVVFPEAVVEAFTTCEDALIVPGLGVVR